MLRSTAAAAVGAFIVSVAYVGTAWSQAKPETLVKERQAAMTLQGKYLYAIVPMATDKLPFDAAIVARNAAYVEMLLKMPWDGFHPSTSGVKETRALPEIFKEEGKFKSLAERAEGEAAKLVSVSKGSDVPAIKAQITSLNNACNACHTPYRRRGG
jgi:cytochrome c556